MFFCFFFQAEDGRRVLVRSGGLGDVYKRQPTNGPARRAPARPGRARRRSLPLCTSPSPRRSTRSSRGAAFALREGSALRARARRRAGVNVTSGGGIEADPSTPRGFFKRSWRRSGRILSRRGGRRGRARKGDLAAHGSRSRGVDEGCRAPAWFRRQAVCGSGSGKASGAVSARVSQARSSLSPRGHGAPVVLAPTVPPPREPEGAAGGMARARADSRPCNHGWPRRFGRSRP
mgnify:CR=1 FL=1